MYTSHQKSVAIFGFILFSPGDGQFTAAPPTCPGDTFTFRCTVTGDRNNVTLWRVNGSIECFLSHTTQHDPRSCGSGSPFTLTTGTGFETQNATSFSSTLSGNATSELNGTLVECFGPGSSREPENMVGNSTFQILGQYHVLSKAITCRQVATSVVYCGYHIWSHYRVSGAGQGPN